MRYYANMKSITWSDLPAKAHNVRGERFGRLVAMEPVYIDSWKQVFWRCKCDCGAIKDIRGKHLWSGKIKSCGCFRVENSRTAFTKHGYARKNQISPTFASWSSMIDRCRNRNNNAYDRYGGRGITVCDRWKKFENFLADMGERPAQLTLERRDNDKGYSPDNCYWATYKQQGRNTCRNRVIEMDGTARCLAEWAEMYKVNSDLVWNRLRLGWTPLKALTEPIHV